MYGYGRPRNVGNMPIKTHSLIGPHLQLTWYFGYEEFDHAFAVPSITSRTVENQREVFERMLKNTSKVSRSVVNTCALLGHESFLFSQHKHHSSLFSKNTDALDGPGDVRGQGRSATSGTCVRPRPCINAPCKQISLVKQTCNQKRILMPKLILEH